MCFIVKAKLHPILFYVLSSELLKKIVIIRIHTNDCIYMILNNKTERKNVPMCRKRHVQKHLFFFFCSYLYYTYRHTNYIINVRNEIGKEMLGYLCMYVGHIFYYRIGIQTCYTHI